jgi:hypothetical protein
MHCAVGCNGRFSVTTVRPKFLACGGIFTYQGKYLRNIIWKRGSMIANFRGGVLNSKIVRVQGPDRFVATKTELQGKRTTMVTLQSAAEQKSHIRDVHSRHSIRHFTQSCNESCGLNINRAFYSIGLGLPALQTKSVAPKTSQNSEMSFAG